MRKITREHKCARCGIDLRSKARTMSRMNTDMICIACAEGEKKHPMYKEACKVEHGHVVRGQYNYPGLFEGQEYPFGYDVDEQRQGIEGEE